MNIINIISKLPRKGTQDSAHSIGSITHIIVHHDAQNRPVAYDSVTRYVQQANYHISRGEDGLQYHYKIDNIGEVFQCRNLTDTLWHCGNYPINRASIAICLDGDYTYQNPTKEQYKALKELLTNLCTQHPEFPAAESSVFGHREVGSSACPGNNFWSWVASYRTSGGAVAIPNVAYNDGSMSNPVEIPQTPPQLPQTLYRVFNQDGTQVGAYVVLDNAKTKLASLLAGVIRDEAGTIIEEKKMVPVADIPPFKGDAVTILEQPNSPPTEKSPSSDFPETPEEPVEPKITLRDLIKKLLDLIFGWFNKKGE